MINNLRSPLNFAGNKTRLLPLIHQYLPQDYSEFIDVFGGSGVVSFSQDKPVVYNEKDTHIYNLVKTMKECDLDFMLERIDFLIRQFDLSKDNKDNYLKFRRNFNDIYYNFLDDYNMTIRHASNLALMVLIFFSFNHFCTFNSSGKFMTPSGYKRSSYNNSTKKSLIQFKNRLENIDSILYNFDFRKMFKIYDGTDLSGKLYFFDPPYMISDDNYRRNYGIAWNKQDETDLYQMCEEINKRGGRFMVINQLTKGDKTNEFLLSFSKKYKTINTHENFHNCSYQRKNKGNDKEIMVINY